MERNSSYSFKSFTIQLNNNWLEEEKAQILDKFRTGVKILQSIVGQANSSGTWYIIKENNTEKFNADAVTNVQKRELHISPFCPWATFLHELYHIFHAPSDFELDIFEEGIAIAASTLACKVIGKKTMFDLEDFLVPEKKLSLIPNDPIVPLDQFIALLPFRYSLLGKFWLDQEKQAPGLLRSMTQIQEEFYKMDPPSRLTQLLTYLAQCNQNTSRSLVTFWNIDRRVSLISEVNSRPLPYFITFYDYINKMIHFVSFAKKLSEIHDSQWKNIGILEYGVPITVQTIFERKDGNGLTNEPQIEINATGLKYFSVKNIPDLIGFSPTGYTVKVVTSKGQILDEIDLII